MVNDDEDLLAMIIDLIAMGLKADLLDENWRAKWINTRVTCHVSHEKSNLSVYKDVDDDQKFFMGNAVKTNIKGVGDVILKIKSRK